MTGFSFLKSYYEAISDEENGLSEEEQGQLYNAIFSYAFTGVVPKLKGASKMVFLVVKGNIDREKQEKQFYSENGKKGGRPKKPPFSKEESQEKGGFSENKGGFFETESQEKGGFLQKEIPLQEKERSKEKEYTLQEKDIPPYNPPTEDETDGTVEGYLEFMREHAYITEDLDNPSELYGIDFALLSQKIAESSRYLQGKQSLKWLLRHYREIIGDSYKDFARPPLPRNDGKGDLQLWQELVKALKSAKEERFCETVGRGSPIYLRLDGAADEEMKVLYRSLSPEIMAYFDPQSFLELCKMNEDDLKYERARFLKALPEIRRKREGNDACSGR